MSIVTPEQLRHWIDWMRMPITAVADELGVSRQSIYSWLNGEYPIPRSVALACAALARGIRAYSLPSESERVATPPAPEKPPGEAAKPQDEPVVLAAPGFGHPFGGN